MIMEILLVASIIFYMNDIDSIFLWTGIVLILCVILMGFAVLKGDKKPKIKITPKNSNEPEVDWASELPDTRKPGREEFWYLIIEGFIEIRTRTINEYGTLTYEVIRHPAAEHVQVITFSENKLNDWGGIEISDDGPPTNGYLLNPKNNGVVMITQDMLRKFGVEETT